MQRVDTKKV